MIGRSGERGSGISVLAARHDDDDDDIEIGGIQRRVTKITKRVKDYSYLERLEKLGF